MATIKAKATLNVDVTQAMANMDKVIAKRKEYTRSSPHYILFNGVLRVFALTIIGIVVIAFTLIQHSGCAATGFDNRPDGSNRSKQIIDGDGNETLSQGAESLSQGVGDINAMGGSNVLVLQAGEASIVGAIMLFGFAAWAVTRWKHDTEHKTARRVIQALDCQHSVFKANSAYGPCKAIKSVKERIEQIGYAGESTNPDRIELNIKSHIDKCEYWTS